MVFIMLEPVSLMVTLLSVFFPNAVTTLSITEHVYHIKEELLIGTRLGNIVTDIPQLNNRKVTSENDDQKTAWKFTIINSMDHGVRLFDLNNNGDLQISGRVDREQLCPQPSSLTNNDYMTYTSAIKQTSDIDALHRHYSNNLEKCIVWLRVVRESQFTTQHSVSQRMDISIGIKIEDINDNAPQWPSDLKRFKVEFRDGDPIGEQRTLPPATDQDSGLNGKIDYRISTVDATRNENIPFSLIVQPMDGISLYATRPIDREEKESYQILLEAFDMAGTGKVNSLQLTATLTVDIFVADINDNTPTFSQPLYTPNSPIPETVAIGTVILVLNATDSDTDLNGAFVFSHSKEHAWMTAETVARNYFEVRSNGEIVVRRTLNVDRTIFPGADSSSQTKGAHREFRFRVTVEDKAMKPYTKSSDATVVIMVQDENDEAPVIAVRPLDVSNSRSNLDHASSMGYLSIMENQPIGTPIFVVQTFDPDFDGTDQVACRVDSSNFTLNPLLGNLEGFPGLDPGWTPFELQTAVELDREATPMQYVAILCSDIAGHVTERKLLIRLTDQNDNSPRFVSETFYLEVEENSPAGTLVQLAEFMNGKVHSTIRGRTTGVYAIDEDAGINAKISYFLSESDQGSSHFRIDKETGTLSTVSVFDREAVQEISLPVFARDHGELPLTGSATVKIFIRDVNDNAPQFDQSEYIFHVLENQPRSSKIGQLNATDKDSNNTGSIHYQLFNDPDAKSIRIDPVTGILRGLTVFDREAQSVYTFRVLARDGFDRMAGRSGSPGDRQLTGTATVTVIVDDENDNWPVFISPNATANTLAIAVDETLGHKLAYVQATDADEVENGRVTYYLRTGNINNIFGLDSDSGLLYLAGVPSASGRGLLTNENNSLIDSAVVMRQDFYILGLEACDCAEESKRKCTTFHNLKILIQNPQKQRDVDEPGNTLGSQHSGIFPYQTVDQSVHRQTDFDNSIIPTAWRRRTPMAYRTTNEIIVICLATLFLFVLLMTLIMLFMLKGKLCGQRRKCTKSAPQVSPTKVQRLWSFVSRTDTKNQTELHHKGQLQEPVCIETSDFPLGTYKSACSFLREKDYLTEELKTPDAMTEDFDSQEYRSVTKTAQSTYKSKPIVYSDHNKHSYQTLEYLGLANCSPSRQPIYQVIRQNRDTPLSHSILTADIWTPRRQYSKSGERNADDGRCNDGRIQRHCHSRSQPQPIDSGFIDYELSGEHTECSNTTGFAPMNQTAYMNDAWGASDYGLQGVFYTTTCGKSENVAQTTKQMTQHVPSQYTVKIDKTSGEVQRQSASKNPSKEGSIIGTSSRHSMNNKLQITTMYHEASFV